MHTLDRMLFLAFLRSYVIVLVSLLSLYVVLDLFTNLDDFSEKGGLEETLVNIGRYYGVRISQIFDRLSEAIALLAAMFTVAWMQRNNELLPQLSAGISAHRVLRPVIVGSMLVLTLGPLNQELIIPRVADQLQADRDDPDQTRKVEVRGVYDSTGVHLEGGMAVRQERKVINGFFATFPETGANEIYHLSAEEAVYVPAGAAGKVPERPDLTGGWILYQTLPEIVPEPLPEALTQLGPRRYFLRTRDADFDALTRRANWYLFASTPKLRELLASPDPVRLAPIAVLFHMRFTRPLVGAILVVFGLAIILRDQNRHVLINTGLCLVMCGLFYIAIYGCKYLGEHDFIAPPLAAWGPVLLFGPAALTYYDAIQS
jgi:lipopolysaccharide export system permease protein